MSDEKYCIYCDTEIEHPNAPAMDDDAAWSEIAPEHQPDCEWVATRAHRLPEA